MDARFDQPSKALRPPKSHRFDVFGLKIRRPVVLYNRPPLDTWVDLESDPSVVWYCERPLLIEEAGVRRVVDFYAVRANREELHICRTEAEARDKQTLLDRCPGFANWCTHNELSVNYQDPMSSPQLSVARANWGQVIRELSAFRRYASTELVSAVRSELAQSLSLSQLRILFPKADPVILKIALFQLLHQGAAVAEEFDRAPFSSDMLFVRA